MKGIIFYLLLALPAVCRGAVLPPEFLTYTANGSGVSRLKAAPAYADMAAGSKAEVIANACAALNLPEGSVAVELPSGGEIWNFSGGKARRLDAWSDKVLPQGPGIKTAGRWFASFGMQSMGGGDYPSSTLNMRLGSTLLQGRYDLALSYDYAKPQESELTSSSLGLVGRALLPLSRHSGWNVGAQWYAADNYGEKSSSFGLVTGINVYLPRGSFDITLNLKDKGDCGLLAGYTIYLSR